MPATTTTPTAPQKGILLTTAFMLFSMFFGAGNLIFPPMLGASAGNEFPIAIIGFFIGGVILPALTIIAIAISGSDVSDLSKRAGKTFGFFFPVLVYLSIGPFYGMPRMGSVAYSMAFVPIAGHDTTTTSIAFNIIFFSIALALAWNSTRLLDSVGRILTPALLLFLAILIIRTLWVLEPQSHPGTEEFTTQPLIAGLLQGYLTMDSIAALAFGIIVIRALRTQGNVSESTIVSQTSISALLAAGLLAIIYLGLGTIGRYIPNPHTYTNGATLLTDAATLTMGDFGRIVFGLAVLAACLTTAVGLLAACAGFFKRLIPQIPYHVWLVSFAVVTCTFAIMGLQTLLHIAGPLIGFLYPIGITLITLTLLAPLFTAYTSLRLTYRVGTSIATIWSALTTLLDINAFTALPSNIANPAHNAINTLTSSVPLHSYQLGWIVPVALACTIAMIWDVTRQTR